jgi:hypothetical protein
MRGLMRRIFRCTPSCSGCGIPRILQLRTSPNGGVEGVGSLLRLENLPRWQRFQSQKTPDPVRQADASNKNACTAFVMVTA